MPQAIAGVAPPEVVEVTTMTVWPSMAATPIGQILGRLYSIQIGIGSVLTIGNLIALAAIPLAIPLYMMGRLPFLGRYYRLTNRRVVIERFYPPQEDRWVGLDNFDAIDVEIKPGQEWYPAGDLVFRKGNVETMRLLGVLRPETFRQTCLKSQRSFMGVQRALEAQLV